MRLPWFLGHNDEITGAASFTGIHAKCRSRPPLHAIVRLATATGADDILKLVRIKRRHY